MAQGVRSNRYGNGATPSTANPFTGKAGSAFADKPGSTRKSINKGKGGSTKKRKAAKR